MKVIKCLSLILMFSFASFLLGGPKGSKDAETKQDITKKKYNESKKITNFDKDQKKAFEMLLNYDQLSKEDKEIFKAAKENLSIINSPIVELYGLTFLIYSIIISKNITLTKMLLNLGANSETTATFNPEIKDSEKNWPPLFWAIQQSLFNPQFDKVVELLLIHNANPNSTDNTGTPALIFAMKEGSAKSFKLLTEHGADINIRQNGKNLSKLVEDHWNMTKIKYSTNSPDYIHAKAKYDFFLNNILKSTLPIPCEIIPTISQYLDI